jgi:hypothetical protein
MFSIYPRVPFDAKSINELRSNILAGNYKPVTPGKYSEELMKLMASMLVQNPAKRPTLDLIFARPTMQKMLAVLPGSQVSEMQQDLISTIKARMLRMPATSYVLPPAPHFFCGRVGVLLAL